MKLMTSVSSRPPRRARRGAALLAWSAIVMVAAGCGQKGPLTLPGAASTTSAKPANPANPIAVPASAPVPR